jgi:LPXTG-site transpeptidase (sortase) family protein
VLLDHQHERARHGRRRRRPWALAIVAAGVVVLSIGTAGLVWASRTGHPAVTAVKVRHVAVPQGFRAQAPAPAAAPAALPVSLTIPAIGVQTNLIHLGLASDGTLQVPSTTKVAGWYTGSPRPGDVGAAVIAGHVDSVAGPGVFFQLRQLHPGDLVYVKRADGSVAAFTVTNVQQYLKTQFPSAAVYGPVPDAELRLVTCGGTFDYATGHYLSNVVVDAVLDTGSASPSPGAAAG